MPKPTVRSMPLAKLRAAGYNPRKISEAALAGLEASIGRWGLVQPLVFNKRSGTLVGGHQRLKVLEARGEKTVQVVVVDLPAVEEKALNLALNNVKIQGDWSSDLAAVLDEVRAVKDMPADLGFDDLIIKDVEPEVAAGDAEGDSGALRIEQVDALQVILDQGAPIKLEAVDGEYICSIKQHRSKGKSVTSAISTAYKKFMG